MISKPSAIDCIIPYSIPLWTIFTKWPAPDGPTCAWPPGSVRSFTNGSICLYASASPPTITQ